MGDVRPFPQPPPEIPDGALRFRVALTPKQRTFYDLIRRSGQTWVGYGGAKGGAKSHGLRGILLMILTEFPGCDVLLLRKTHDEVYKNHVLRLWDEYPELEQFYVKNEKILYLPNGSRWHFGSGENEGEVRKYNGAADFIVIAVDQAEEFSEGDLGILKSCIRSTKHDFTPKLALTFNPGGISHAFLKRIFLDREYLPNEQPEAYAPLLRAYGWDNFFWLRPEAKEEGITAREYYGWSEEQRREFFLRSKYGKALVGLAPDLQSKYLWGSFDLFAGQYFHKFNPSRVGYFPGEAQILDYWPRWASIDGGYNHPAAAYLHTWDGTRVYTVDEFVMSGLEPRELAHALARRWVWDETTGKPMENPPQIVDCLLSFDWFNKTQSEKTRADEFGEVWQSYGLPFPRESSRDRIGRLRLASSMMSDDTGDGFPSWRINRTVCLNLMKTLPLGIRDPKNDEDMLKFNGDDPIDGATYGLQINFREINVPREVRIAQRVTSLDPNTRAMQARIAAAEEGDAVPFVSMRRHMR